VTWLQDSPRLSDAWETDPILRNSLRWHLGPEAFALAEPELAEMGTMATSEEMLELGDRAEREPPEHVPFSPWGERIDSVNVSTAYKELGRLGIEAGITARPYEASPYGDKARLVWGGLLAMWGPSSALYSCPVAMTDGAARTLLEHGEGRHQSVVDKLTSRDPNKAWTSGQWMTETAGGSDVSGTSTVAEDMPDGSWQLHGVKWFTSSIDSQTALALARPTGAGDGSRSLALFRVDRILDDGRVNAIEIRRLKDKLGTRALPTAEIELLGALAHPVGDPQVGGGLKKIATMLTITRIHNAFGSAAAIGRGLAWARAYARVRRIKGTLLEDLPAHRVTLAELMVDYAVALELAMRCSEILGRVEHHVATPSDVAVLRALTPIAKLTTAKSAVAGVAEAMESVGGVGYCEDSTIPALVRNTHVLTIWEGTTNVLALDLLRTIATGELDAPLQDATEAAEEAARSEATADSSKAALSALQSIKQKILELQDESAAEAFARTLAIGVANTYACARLGLQGAHDAARGEMRTATIAARLAARGLLPHGPIVDPNVILDD
jgi:alkylation response protein AidB-like acyl-CoA dehydrogenase